MKRAKFILDLVNKKDDAGNEVAWWVTLIIVLVTLAFCAILIFIVKLFKGSEKASEEEQKKDKCIQVHESQARLKLTSVVKSVNLSTQEENEVHRNRVDVTSETYYTVQTHLSKYQLDQFPWWSYMFVVVGGFMVCMFLNYVVNRVNAARFERYEQLRHANDSDKPSELKLKMPKECPKQGKGYGEVKEITLVFTQDENRRQSQDATRSENVLIKPTSQTINQTTRKPIQIQDSLILGNVTEKIFERQLIDHGVETEPVDLDLESEPGDRDVESEPVHLTVEREPVCKTIEREAVHRTIERQPVYQTGASEPVHLPSERESLHLSIEREPVDLPIEKEPVHLSNERESECLTIESESVHLLVERVPAHLPIEREPVNVQVHQGEIKNIKLSASMPTISHLEIINEVAIVRHYASDVSLSPCNEEMAENKHW